MNITETLLLGVTRNWSSKLSNKFWGFIIFEMLQTKVQVKILLQNGQLLHEQPLYYTIKRVPMPQISKTKFLL